MQQESRIRILGSVAARALFKGHLQGHLKASSRTPSRSPRGHLQGILGSVASRALFKKNSHEASSRTPRGNADPMFGPVARPEVYRVGRFTRCLEGVLEVTLKMSSRMP